MNSARVADYLCSIPERAFRSFCALAGGTFHELADVALPARVRRSKIYDALVESTTRFLIENIGQVNASYPKREALPANFLVRRAAGNVLEVAGLVTFRASPVWVLAALADLAGAGRDLIPEIARALEQDGLLEPGRQFESLDQLLDGLERSLARLAEAVNTPPLDLPGLRAEWSGLRAEAAQIPRAFLPTAAQLREQWRELQSEAARQKRSPWELSTAIAVAAVRKLPDNARWLTAAVRTAGQRTGEVLANGLLAHYHNELAQMRRTGFLRYWLRELRPYLRAALGQFSPGRTSTTERLLSRRRMR